MGGVDHLRIGRSAALRQFAEQPLPHAALGPAHEAIVDRRMGAVFRRAIAPPAAAPQNMQNAADHAPVVHPILAAHVRRQLRLDLTPLLIAQLKQVVPHSIASRITEQRNHQPIQLTMTLLGFGPSHPSLSV